jgi:glycosyltransferase involved in cell wall biosynthesis
LVVNAREREALQQIAPSAAIEVVEVGIDSDLFASATPPAPSPEVVFCGVLDYVPNIEGVRWFVVNVWPLVRAQVPDAHLTLVGSRPTRSVRRLGNHAGVDVTGDVPDVRPYLWRAAVGVAPLLTARGIQNKVLEMLAAGLPVVTTPTVSAGRPASVPRCSFARDVCC